ncbi:protein GL2-INTERACTING REPRESSOR 1-like [Salvia divinorum]|uniref:Protein GL2-INTERACTING REPRESSOR 1-like n=1 Tax=Salvia divinorum TaxID=28513 RepID=A0ABD1GIU4_SALDI
MQFNSLVEVLGVAEMKKYDGESPKLELKLNLSPPGEHRQVVSPRGAGISPRSSCVSRETSPEAMSMMLVGCPRCLMKIFSEKGGSWKGKESRRSIYSNQEHPK